MARASQAVVHIPVVLRDMIKEKARDEGRDMANMARILIMEALDYRAQRGSLFKSHAPRTIRDIQDIEKMLPDDCELIQKVVEGHKNKQWVAVCPMDSNSHRITLPDGTACFGMWPGLLVARNDIEGTRKHGSFSLTNRKVVEVKNRYDRGESIKEIATSLDVGYYTIRDIIREKTWQKVQK